MARSLIPFVFETGFPSTHSLADPFLQLRREMNRVFDDTLRGFGGSGATGAAALGGPRMNVSETDQALHVEAELPGVPEHDVRVELNDDMLTISGEKKASREDQNLHVVERSFGSFSRAIRLPFAVSPARVQARFEHGVLTVTLPKAPENRKVHRIQVQSGSGHGVIEGMSRAGSDGADGERRAEGGNGGGERQVIAEGMSKAGGKHAGESAGATSGGPANRGLSEKVAKAGQSADGGAQRGTP